MNLLRFLVFGVCLFFLSGCVPEEVSILLNVEELVEQRIDDPAKKAEALKKVAADVKAFPAITAAYEICPASNFGKQRRWIDKQLSSAFGETEYTTEICSLVPELCAMACKDTEPAACFNLARAFQDSDDLEVTQVARPVFAYSCVVGSTIGCVNRGSGMRNTMIDADPASKMTVEDRELCQFNLFKLGCDNGSTWGCTMTGQAYLLGEGVQKNKVIARTHLKKSCANDDDGGCPMAKRLAESHGLGTIIGAGEKPAKPSQD